MRIVVKLFDSLGINQNEEHTLTDPLMVCGTIHNLSLSTHCVIMFANNGRSIFCVARKIIRYEDQMVIEAIPYNPFRLN